MPGGVNCAGLTASRIACPIEGMPIELVPQEHCAHGH